MADEDEIMKVSSWMLRITLDKAMTYDLIPLAQVVEKILAHIGADNFNIISEV